MLQQELLSNVIGQLDAAGIAYMLTGSFASSLQGEPRSTHDIDLVVQLAPPHIDRLIQAFPSPEYYLSPDAIADAIRNRSMFNLIDTESGQRVDFWMTTDEPYDQSRFSRRRTGTIRGLSVWVSSPEDTILAKLRWARLSGGSEKQFRDALRVFEVQGSALDRTYLDDWANRLGVEDLWRRLQDEAEIVELD